MAVTQVGSPAISSAASNPTSLTISLPQTPTSGNLLVMVLCANSGNSNNLPTMSAPSGWTNVAGLTGSQTVTITTQTAVAFYYRIADGTEGTSTSTSLTNTLNAYAFVGEWNGLAASSVLDANATLSKSAPNNTSGSPTLNSVTTSTADTWLFSFGVQLVGSAATAVTQSFGGAVSTQDSPTLQNRFAVGTGVATKTSTGTYTPTWSYTSTGANTNPVLEGTAAFKVNVSTTLSPTGIASAEAFGTPSVSTPLTASPTSIGSATAFGTPTVSGALTASPDPITSAEAVGSPAISSTLTVSPTAITSAESVGTPTLSATLTVSPTGIASQEAFGTPSAGSGLLLYPTGIASAESVGSPTITPGALTASPSGIASAETLGAPTVTPGALTASPVGIGSSAAFGSPTVTMLAVAYPDGIPSAETFGTPAALGDGSITGLRLGTQFLPERFTPTIKTDRWSVALVADRFSITIED